MINYLLKKSTLLVLFSTCIINVFAQKVNEPAKVDSNWKRNCEPFRIVGNLYYVGTYDLSCYLITTTQGNILINTGLSSSLATIKSNVESLGFKFSDIKILLTTQAHYDHMGAMAAVKKMTGARFYINEPDKQVIEDGGSSDYEMGGHGYMYQPLKADKVLHNGDIVALGEMKLQLLSHPGHTKGSCSYLLNVKDSSGTYRVLIANLPTIITERKFSDVTGYPGIEHDYAVTLSSMKKLDFDIWVASHASQFKLHDKRKKGDAYNPAAFMDKAGYNEALAELQASYDEKIKVK